MCIAVKGARGGTSQRALAPFVVALSGTPAGALYRLVERGLTFPVEIQNHHQSAAYVAGLASATAGNLGRHGMHQGIDCHLRAAGDYSVQ